MEKFANRQDAGRQLSQLLKDYADRQDTIVLALPRGGVPVAFEVAQRLHLPLDVFIVRKLGAPGHEELALGAIAMGGAQVLNEEIINELHISKIALEQVISAERQELKRRELVYRGKRPALNLKDKVIILVDDGIATGATMRVAIKSLRQFQPAAIVIAIPVAEKSLNDKMLLVADKVFCALVPSVLQAVGAHYVNFEQTMDIEVHDLLTQSQQEKGKEV
jgi:putative phosphoribosyl transferase